MTQLRVWAPYAETVASQVDDSEFAMAKTDDGWWRVDVPSASHGDDYAFTVDGSSPLPDPRSAWLPHGVNGPSRLYDHASFSWSDSTWRGVPLAGSVIYELHVGTFTPEGTFDAAMQHLDHLVELGIDLIELLPVATFDGDRGWGYDGVGLFAPHESYGGPDGLKRLVDACHARGLGVVMDVVYNHLGPSGNHLATFGPYFTELHHTPWGAAVNLNDYGSDEVRGFIIDNALGWLRDFHIDGLRLDAVHAFVDNRAITMLEELGRSVHGLAATLGRPLFLIAESDLNDPRIITPADGGGIGMDAQWTDDVHHSLHAALTGEQQGYYSDFGSLATLASALESAFVHTDTWSTFRGRRHGRQFDQSSMPGSRFVTFLQDHDQIGNRAQGDRTSNLLSPGLLRVGAALLFGSAFTPMLFMGEEWGARTPWQFFTAFPNPELAQAVTMGRRKEFASHGWGDEDVPDPQELKTFEQSKLDWSELEDEEHSELFSWHRELIQLRRQVPELTDGRLDLVSCSYDEDQRWFVMRRGDVVVVCNLSGDVQEIPVDGRPRELLSASAPGFSFREGAVTLAAESAAFVRLVSEGNPVVHS